VPPAPIPPEIAELLRKPNPAVVATVRPDGSPHSVATWYDLVDGLILLNMAATRARLGHIRRDPHVSLTVLDEADWYTHVTLTGMIDRLVDDLDLADIDRLALRYQGRPFRNREDARVSAWMRCERWYRWD
jgi:PPOX class probable F420-dependent enzyme